MLVRADDLDKAVEGADSLDALVRAIEALSGRAHRLAQQGVSRPAPSPLEAVRAAAQDYEAARRRRDAAVAAAKAALAAEGAASGAGALREIAEAANLSLGRVKQITGGATQG